MTKRSHREPFAPIFGSITRVTSGLQNQKSGFDPSLPRSPLQPAEARKGLHNGESGQPEKFAGDDGKRRGSEKDPIVLPSWAA